jgi:hypothetical protein
MSYFCHAFYMFRSKHLSVTNVTISREVKWVQVVPLYVIQTHGEVEVYLQHFLTSEVDTYVSPTPCSL